MKDATSIPGKVREFKTSDGFVLKYRHYRPTGFPPRAYVIGLHGIQSHSGWYEWSSSRLAVAGYDVRFLDRRGSGLNERHRGHTRNASQLCSDVLELLAKVLHDRSGFQSPIVLTAVSWGGKLATGFTEYFREIWQFMRCTNWPMERFLLSDQAIDMLNLGEGTLEGLEEADVRPFAGIALLYPAVFTRFDPNANRRFAIRTAHTLGLGRKTVPIPLNDPALFTDDPQWQAFIRDDPLTLRRVSLSFLNATMKLTEWSKQFPDRNPPPTFVALAGRDEIVDLPKTRQWAARLPEETTRIVEYPNARHTLEFDACREEIIADLIEWIEQIICL